MPPKKVKSESYLNFLSNKKCVISGSSSIDIHHESLLSGFRGSAKRYNDFQALPLDKDLHIGVRHLLGKEKFWEKYRVNPYEISEKLLIEYLSTGPLDAEVALLYLEEVRSLKNQWKGDYSPKYKSL